VKKKLLEDAQERILVRHCVLNCNPSYLGDQDQESHGSRPAWGKNVPENPHLNRKNAGCGGVHLSSQPWWEM
jgi:hypothetical protein